MKKIVIYGLMTLNIITMLSLYLVLRPVYELYGVKYTLSVLQTFFKLKDFYNLPESIGLFAKGAIIAQPDTLEIKMNQKHRERLEKSRVERMQGVDTGAYHKAEVRFREELSKVKIRIKGDRDVHFKYADKPSYRIKTKGQSVINGMKAFSIHHPAARNYLSEYLFINLVGELGIIQPKYEFIKVKINDKNYRTYALEEYPSKYLLERSKRREGPIYRFNEESVLFDTDIISSMKDVSKKGVEQRINMNGGRLIESFRQGIVGVDDAFDSILMGRFFAAATLIESEHALVAKSSRFYYNPITLKLEPIPFDAHSQNKISVAVASGLGRGLPQDWTNSASNAWFNLFWKTGNNFHFVDSYLDTLNMFITDGWLNSFFDRQASNIKKSLETIYSDFPPKDYTWNYGPARYIWNDKFIIEKVHLIKQEFSKPIQIMQDDRGYTFINPSLLPAFISIENCAGLDVNKENIVYLPPADVNGPSITPTRHDNYFCKGRATFSSKYRIFEEVPASNIESKAAKRYAVPVRAAINVERFGDKLYFQNTRSSSILIKSIECKDRLPISLDLNLKSEPKELFGDKFLYTAVSIPEEYRRCKKFKIKLSNGEYKNIQPVQHYPVFQFNELERKSVKELINFGFEKEGNTLSLKSSIVVNKPIFIPAGYRVMLHGGIKVDIVDSAYIYSESPLEIGNQSKGQVLITSSDFSGRGVHVASYSSSKLRNVRLSNMVSFNDPSRLLTGALTFIGGDVSISNLMIHDIRAEDALNIINAKIDVNGLSIERVSSDGFDCDFCIGTISSAAISNTGNDGFDFSGSRLDIRDVIFSYIKDKGISLGENSYAEIKNVVVDRASIGLASKDLSTLKVSDSHIKYCDVALAAYQKKPEFGGGTILYTGTKFDGQVQRDGASIIEEIY